jgi:uncharacterized membrane protein YedE/YeeE
MTIGKIKYFLLGIVFGFILVKAEVVSWFRIQEMFRFQSFHMYGVIMSAIIVGIISIQLIKKFQTKTINGEEIIIEPKRFSWGNIIGGTIFGLGWSLTGACPGPLYALFGSGIYVIGVSLLSAIAGVFIYGVFAEKLPH